MGKASGPAPNADDHLLDELLGRVATVGARLGQFQGKRVTRPRSLTALMGVEIRYAAATVNQFRCSSRSVVFQRITQPRCRIQSIEFGRAEQRLNGSGALASTLGSGKEPVPASPLSGYQLFVGAHLDLIQSTPPCNRGTLNL